ncbi:MAG: TonB-dependent receptor [Rhodospirillales bacterium]|nr:TonB-dependent receptor [Rhodospirillales bacterium]
MLSHTVRGRRALASSRALVPATLTVSLLAGLYAQPGFAQSPTDLPPVTVDVVEEEKKVDEKGAKLLGKTTIKEADIAPKRLSTSDTAKLLKDVAGVSLYSAGGVSSLPAIRGMADDRIKTTINGMPAAASCPNHMNPTLSYVDPNDVAKIEALAGVTPVSAGGDSIAGSINVEKAKPTFAALGEGLHTQGRLSTAYRSNNHSMTASGDVAAATENFSIGYNGSWTQAGDYHRGGKGEPVLTSKYMVKNHALTAAVEKDGHLIIVEGGRQSIPYEGFPNQRMDLTGNTSDFANGRYEGEFGWGMLDGRVYVRDTTHEMNFIGSIKGASMPMNTDSLEWGYLVNGEISLSERDTLRVGNGFNHFRLDDWWPSIGGMMMGPNDFWNIADGQRDRLGTFAEWEAGWTDQWTTLVGVRNDTVWMNTGDVQGYNTTATYSTDVAAFNALDRKKTDANFDWSALARYEADASSTYEAGLARKTRSPNLHERYSWSTGAMAMNMNNWVGDGNGYIGDINLKPEVAHTLSVSADWHDPARKTWGVKVTPYFTVVKDYIDADRRTGQTATTDFIKLQLANHDARLYGADVSGDLEVWERSDYGRGVVKAAVGLVKGENTDTNASLYNIMPLHGRIALEHNLGGWSNAIEFEGALSKSDVSQTRNEIETPAYGLMHLRTGYEWDNISLNAGVENVFDKLYHLPLGGADMADSGSKWGYNVFGAGRSYVAGATVRF